MPDLKMHYRDESLACIEKPAGLRSVPGKGESGRDCVVARVEQQTGWAREAHRLDMDTSGLMLVALDPHSHRDLCRQFRQREIEKEYAAIVFGQVSADRGEIDLPIRADIDNRPRQVVDHHAGKEARTIYEVKSRDGRTTRLRLIPLTGRSHQLRLHLAAVGHPILGDDLYAPPEVLAMSDRLLLHATRLSVSHPRTGVRLEFASPCPF